MTEGGGRCTYYGYNIRDDCNGVNESSLGLSHLIKADVVGMKEKRKTATDFIISASSAVPLWSWTVFDEREKTTPQAAECVWSL